ncbi:MAG: hypothetical protein OXC60_03665 [Litoreibacter sp.]|nr:hypothetical protein [Litoreibacter sp.]MCY4333754.1 hypothetical protein [Litoreibacter sp.]
MKVKTAFAAVAATIFPPLPVLAQEQVCGERAVIVNQLENKHGEFRRSAGLQDNMVLVEVFASDAGTWTILFTKPTGLSCFMAVGRSWEDDLMKQGSSAGKAL